MIQAQAQAHRTTPIDTTSVRLDFRFFKDAAAGVPHYLDNAATTQKPDCVIQAIADCYARHSAPVHRGLYPLADSATRQYEKARSRLARFLGVAADDELIFTRSATEAINMVAWGWARQHLSPGDQVWLTRQEHHSNYLPWQRVCQEQGAELRIIELQPDGSLDLAGSPELFGPKTRFIAICLVSNVLGLENPVAELCAAARSLDIPVLVDAAQAVPHLPVDVLELGCDFLVCSAHKMYGPSGIGLLYGRAERLRSMEPLLLGGGMVDYVADARGVSSWADIPARFEAGSPDLAGAAGFAAAADYLDGLGRSRVREHLERLTRIAGQALSALPGVRLLATEGTALISFTVDGVHPHDLAQFAGEQGVAIRAGHHCAQPLMRSLDLVASARASFAVYNDEDDVQALVNAVSQAQRVFS
ncbi:MAG: cysteine desulfurase [Gammaproteobacteria bacterium]|nr:cysteine desulfurase [Gammaproteobacteria bacterium]